ncbi:uncharacterized protein KQ657_004046 [Scheffersomyces spartinae]|uniref:Amino acid permease/ SLC12A domain-containing protein n=1 Tax=Scheffersomyces spartinae TaxID=45513 RepID=A0A9P7VBN2_9ASCO|nr:uncharacterized protein KQ657_004046 [Scheffersomyces spartinae]KAG7194937.1 hypothetical protein KQ657_004046 [Scheffersomyces spartinae]
MLWLRESKRVIFDPGAIVNGSTTTATDGTHYNEDKISTCDPEVLTLDERTRFKDFQDDFNPLKNGEVKRKLSSRHMTLMILGQCIGTGLFVGLAAPLVYGGSLALFLGFVAYAVLMIWPLMQCVGEMCCYLPLRGAFVHFSARWVDPALGFAVSIMYFYTSTMYICLEAVAFGGIIAYWKPDINSSVWITLCLISYALLNVWGVNWYGEIEFYSSLAKVLLIIGLMLFSLISMCGGNPKGEAYGFSNWPKGGLVKEYLATGAWGRLSAFWMVMIYAALSCGGPDLLAICAGEARRPRHTISLGARRTYIRIYLFYFGGIFFMNTLCASNNKDLLVSLSTSEGATASPWVIGIKSVGVHGLDSMINAVILSSAWSCGNGFFYGSTRTAYSASLAGYLPRIFSKCLSNGTPITAVILVFCLSGLSYLAVGYSSFTVFQWFINLSSTGILCTYLCIWICFFRFRAAMKAQGKDIDSPDYPYFKAPWFVHPFMSYFGCFFNAAVLFFNGYWIFLPGQFSVTNLFTTYFSTVLFVVLYFSWKFIRGTSFKSSTEADITTGKAAIDFQEELEIEEDRKAKENLGKRWKYGYKVYDFLFT